MSAPGRRGRTPASHRFARTKRVNEILREVLAEELLRLGDVGERVGELTITAVRCEPDLRHATVLLASLDSDVEPALAKARPRLQAAVSRQVRLKRTPLLSFAADPAVASGQRIEDILRRIRPGRAEGTAAGAPDAEPG